MSRQWTDKGAYEYISLPNQTQAAFCYGFVIPEKLRMIGAGTALKGVQNAMLQDMKYDYALATVDSTNVGMLRIMGKSGWRKIDAFFNSRSGTMTTVWSFKVNQQSSNDDEVAIPTGAHRVTECLPDSTERVITNLGEVFYHNGRWFFPMDSGSVREVPGGDVLITWWMPK